MKQSSTLLAAIATLLLFTSSALAQGNPVAGMEIQLKNSDGRVVQKTTTNSDGAWSFTNVAVGDYSVFIDQKAIDNSRMAITEQGIPDRKKAKKAAKKAARADGSGDPDTDDDGVPDISFTLSYSKIEFEYKKQDEKGRMAGEAPSDDSGSGLATGKRVHKPVTFIKEWGASPQLTVKEPKSTVSGTMSWDLATLKK